MTGRIKREEAAIKRTLPVIGKLKIGEKTDKGYPISLDYFKPDGKYASLFNEQFPEKPNKIQIVFMSDSFAESCNERYECWDKEGRKLGFGDGENFSLFDEKTKDYTIEANKEQAASLTKDKGKWSAVLTIRFLIPKIKGVMGLWELSTKGVRSSINNLRDTFDGVLNQAGRVRGIPFDLLIHKHVSRKPGAKSVYPVIDLVPNLSQESILVLQEFTGATHLDKVGILTDENVLALKEKTQ